MEELYTTRKDALQKALTYLEGELVAAWAVSIHEL